MDCHHVLIPKLTQWGLYTKCCEERRGNKDMDVQSICMLVVIAFGSPYGSIDSLQALSFNIFYVSNVCLVAHF